MFTEKRLELLWKVAFTGVFVYLAFFTPKDTVRYQVVAGCRDDLFDQMGGARQSWLGEYFHIEFQQCIKDRLPTVRARVPQSQPLDS